MRLSHFFIDRPIFATVVSVLITLIGAISYFALPVAQYPEIAPPTIVVRTSYPGADPQTIADTVSTPLEQQINGVPGMTYMSSTSSNDGSATITITFDVGYPLAIAAVDVQNRVAQAASSLPPIVNQAGVTIRKQNPNFVLIVNLTSPDKSVDPIALSNYAALQIVDPLARLDGVGDIRVFGARDYSMRVWLDPGKVAARNLTAGEVVRALQAQNVQVAAGVLDAPPTPHQGAFQLNVQTKGRLTDPAEFENVIVKSDGQGRITRIKDIGRVELGALDYSVNGYLDSRPAGRYPGRPRGGHPG